jgi:uncharacterized protein YggU (UPF0235/DUF167 family)
MDPDAVALWIQPRSSRDQVVGEREGAIAIRLKAPPVDGAANAALVRLLRGHTGRRKWVSVEGLSAGELRAALLAAADAG